MILVKICLKQREVKTNNAFETLFLLQLQWMALFQNVTIAEPCWTGSIDVKMNSFTDLIKIMKF